MPFTRSLDNAAPTMLAAATASLASPFHSSARAALAARGSNAPSVSRLQASAGKSTGRPTGASQSGAAATISARQLAASARLLP